MSLNVRVLADGAATSAGMQQLWDRLHAANPDAPAVLGREWADFSAALYPTVGEDITMVVEADGEPVGLWPLRLVRGTNRYLGSRILRNRCVTQTYFGDAVLSPGIDPVAAHRACLEAAATIKGWDSIDIWRVANPQVIANIPCEEIMPANSVWFSDVESGAASRGINRRLKKLQRLPDFRISEIGSGDELLLAAADFARLHTILKRYQGQTLSFHKSPGAAERFPAALQQLAASGIASILAFHVGPRLLAAQVLLHHQRNTVLWRVAWDPEFAALSPGIAILDHSIELSRQRGDTAYHLGPGRESYKQKWASPEAKVARICRRRNTPRAFAASLYWKLGAVRRKIRKN